MRPIRWWIFKKLSWLGWKICPEPDRSLLQSMMPTRAEWEGRLSSLKKVGSQCSTS